MTSETTERFIDVTSKLNELVKDIGHRVPRLKHVQRAEIAFLVHVPRAHTCGGNNWAKIVSNCPTTRSKDASRTVPFLVEGRPCRYLIIISARLLLRLPKLDRMRTIVHELYHMHPHADGRRRNQRHGKAFEQQVSFCLEQYLARAPRENYAWLTNLQSSDKVMCVKYVRHPKDRRLFNVSWEHFVRSEPRGTTLMVLQMFGQVVTQRIVLPLDSIAKEPRFLYRCQYRHEVRVWGKFRIPRYCGICLHQHERQEPFVLVAET